MVKINETAPEPEGDSPKLVKAMPISPVYAMFDIVEIEGKQVITGSIGFVDQFGMQRMAKTASVKSILGLGSHIIALFSGEVDVTEPDEFTKEKLAKEVDEDQRLAKAKLVEAFRAIPSENANTSEPPAAPNEDTKDA